MNLSHDWPENVLVSLVVNAILEREIDRVVFARTSTVVLHVASPWEIFSESIAQQRRKYAATAATRNCKGTHLWNDVVITRSVV